MIQHIPRFEKNDNHVRKAGAYTSGIHDMKDIDHSCKDQKGLMLGGRAGGGGGGEGQSDKRDQVIPTV